MTKSLIQYGGSASADFEKNTWTFDMYEGFKVAAGEHVIMPCATYEAIRTSHAELVKALEDLLEIDDGDVPGLWPFESAFEAARTALAAAKGLE